MGNLQAVLDEFAYMIDERDAKDRNAKKIQKRMIDSFIDRNYQESDPYVYTWNDIFKQAGKEAKDKGFCDLVPYWSIPRDMLNAIDGSEIEAIESIISTKHGLRQIQTHEVGITPLPSDDGTAKTRGTSRTLQRHDKRRHRSIIV